MESFAAKVLHVMPRRAHKKQNAAGGPEWKERLAAGGRDNQQLNFLECAARSQTRNAVR